MDSASENENPEAVLANIGSLLLSAAQDIESDALLDPVGPDPGALFQEQFPDATQDPYGSYDTSTAYGASVMHAIDYMGMTLEEAEEWALGATPPPLLGGTVRGGLPSPGDVDEAYFANLEEMEESAFDVNMPAGMPPPKGFRGLGPDEGISWFDDVSMYDDATLENLETWDLYFKTLPIEYAKEDYGPGIQPSLAEFSVKHFKKAFADRENKEQHAGHIFTWLYKNSQGKDGKETFPSIGLTGEDFTNIISVGFTENGISGASLSENKDLSYAADLFSQDEAGTWLFPEYGQIKNHTSLTRSSEGREYYEDIIDAGRSTRDIFDRAFEEKYPGLTSDWYKAKASGLFQDAMMDRYFSRWDETQDIYTGFDDEETRVKRPFAADEEWLEDWLEDPAEHQTALFGNVSELADYLHLHKWGAFQGEDYARLTGATSALGDEEQKYKDVVTVDEADVDKRIAGNLGLNLDDPDDRKRFMQYKVFNPLLYKAGSARYDAAVQAIKQAAVSALTPVAASAASRSSMTKQINKDYDIYTSTGQGSPLSFLQHMLSGGRIVSSQSLAPEWQQQLGYLQPQQGNNPMLRLPGFGMGSMDTMTLQAIEEGALDPPPNLPPNMKPVIKY